MKLQIICVGKLKEDYLKKLIQQYSSQIRKKYVFEIIELADEKTPDNASEKEELKIRQIEGARILSRIPPEGIVVPLCIEGKQLSTSEFQTKWLQWLQSDVPSVTFIIGGSLGLSKEVIAKGKLKLSFSKMTFPHQLMRLILIEQLSLL